MENCTRHKIIVRITLVAFNKDETFNTMANKIIAVQIALKQVQCKYATKA